MVGEALALLRATVEGMPHAAAAFSGAGERLAANARFEALAREALGGGAPASLAALLEEVLARAGAVAGSGPALAALRRGEPLLVDLPQGLTLELRLGPSAAGFELLEMADQTASHRRERILAQFESLVCGSGWTWNLGTGEIAFAEAVWSVLGPGAREAMSSIDGWRAHVDRADLPELDRRIAHSLATGAPYEYEYRIHPPGGPSRILHALGRVVETHQGQPTLGVGVFRDVTSEREKERALEESEGRFRAVLESMDDLVAILSTDGRLRYPNAAASRILGYSSRALEGKSISELVHGDDLPLARERIAFVVAHPGEPTQVELRVRRGDGGIRILQVSGRHLPHVAGIGAILIVGRDVTELRDVQAQLHQSQKVEALGRLASGIAHDFNNVLTAILGNAELLASHLAPGSEAAREAEEIRRAADHAAALTRRLLAIARREPSTSERIDVDRLCGEVASVLSRSVDRRVVVETELASRPATLLGDPTQLKGALLNLGINAAEAMPQGGVLRFATRTVSLGERAAARARCAPGRYVEVTVTDSGSGIAPELRERIFEPFFTTKQEGTGLGLAMVSACTASHRGAVALESEPGRGTRFRLYFPLPEHAAERGEAALPLETASAPGKLRVLVVDDEPTVRRFCRVALEALGYEVATTDDDAALLERLHDEAEPVDVVVLDLNMPVRHGTELLQEILEAAPATRVLISSGHADDATRRELLALGAAGFLAKPYRIRDLGDAVRRAYESRRVPGAPG